MTRESKARLPPVFTGRGPGHDLGAGGRLEPAPHCSAAGTQQVQHPEQVGCARTEGRGGR